MEEYLYKVVTTGDIKEGFDRDAVRQSVAKTFKLSESKAQELLEKRVVIKKNADHQRASSLKKKLDNIGIVTELKRYEPPKSETTAFKLELTPIEGEKEQVSERGENEKVLGLAQEGTGEMTCPKCQLQQVKAKQCMGCGVFVDKVRAMNSSIESEPASDDERRQKRSAQLEAQDNDGHFALDSVFNMPALAAASGVAIVGAFLWKFIAITFDFELGLVAWLIGGAIGFVASLMGARGDNMGIACGVLALLAILAGKYMVMSSVQSSWSEIIVQGFDEDVSRAMYNEEKRMADSYLKVGSEDEAQRAFMLDYGYTDAYALAEITATEMADFNEVSAPRLNLLASDGMTYEEWMASQQDLVESVSTFDLMADNLGLLDIVFLILGVGTAFKLGRGPDVA